MNTTTVFPGASVAVVGCGGVGLSVIQGAKIQGARQIIAVDVNPVKLGWAKEFGATDVVAVAEELVDAHKEVLRGQAYDPARTVCAAP
jgi:Zn-dependent alcohol dehydrogenase